MDCSLVPTVSTESSKSHGENFRGQAQNSEIRGKFPTIRYNNVTV